TRTRNSTTDRTAASGLGARPVLTRRFDRTERSRSPSADPDMFGRHKTAEVRVSVFGKTDLGRSREHNEDHFLVADLTRGDASLPQPVREHSVGNRGSLLIVADGMGGAAAGEVASEMAT